MVRSVTKTKITEIADTNDKTSPNNLKRKELHFSYKWSAPVTATFVKPHLNCKLIKLCNEKLL